MIKSGERVAKECVNRVKKLGNGLLERPNGVTKIDGIKCVTPKGTPFKSDTQLIKFSQEPSPDN